jgi:hypothetical protein
MACSILLVVERHEGDGPRAREYWEGCAKNLSAIASKDKDIQVLGENVVLISLARSLEPLSEVLRGLLSMSYRYAVLDDEDIEWHEVTR